MSANLQGPGIAPFLVLERGGLRIGVTGVSADEPTLTETPGYIRLSPEAAEAVVRQLAGEADVVVILSWHAAEVARAFAATLPGVDVVIDANRHREEQAPFRVGGAVWALADEGGLRIGELRLGLDGGRVTGALDRHIDLDETIPDDRVLARMQADARAEIDALQATGP